MTSGENRGIKELRAGTGYGPRAALIHGGANPWRAWCPLVRHLDLSWQILAFDLPWRNRDHFGLRRAGTPGRWVTDFCHNPRSRSRPDRRACAGRQRLARAPGFKPEISSAGRSPHYSDLLPRGTTIDAVRAGCRQAFDGDVREIVRDRLEKRAMLPAANVVGSIITNRINGTTP